MGKLNRIASSAPRVRNEQLLREMLSKGIRFHVPLVTFSYGTYLMADEVFAYLENPVAFSAAYFGVTVEHIAYYEDYIRGGHHCTYIKRNGETCSRYGTFTPGHPESLVPGVTDRCSKHRISPLPKDGVEIDDSYLEEVWPSIPYKTPHHNSLEAHRLWVTTNPPAIHSGQMSQVPSAESRT